MVKKKKKLTRFKCKAMFVAVEWLDMSCWLNLHRTFFGSSFTISPHIRLYIPDIVKDLNPCRQDAPLSVTDHGK